MIILRKKRILLVLSCVIISVCVFSLGLLNRNNTAIPTVSLPVSNRVIVLDAGHRKSRPVGRKVQMGCMKMI